MSGLAKISVNFHCTIFILTKNYLICKYTSKYTSEDITKVISGLDPNKAHGHDTEADLGLLQHPRWSAL